MKLNAALLPKDKIIGVACSGGRDSMVLLHALRAQGFSCAVLHVNHALRETALRDEEFVQGASEAMGLPFRAYHAGPGQFGTSNIENKAREFRKACYADAVESGFCDLVATAHHADDNAETVLLHLLRGSGAKGLCGIPEKNGVVVRPLLSVTRDEIDAYATLHGVAYCDDETNALSHYDRNYLRNEILPRLKARWGEAVQNLCRASHIIAQDDEVLRALTPAPCVKNGETVLALSPDTPTALRHRAIQNALSSIAPYDFEYKHICAIDALASSQSGTGIDLPNGVRAVNDYGALTLYRPTEPTPLEVRWRAEDCTVDGYPVRISSDTTIPSAPVLAFDAESVPEGAVWRRRQEGDVFTPFGGGTRSLKEYFIDKKVSARLRDNLVLLCYNKEVLVIAGVEISRKVQIHKGSRLVATVGVRNV